MALNVQRPTPHIPARRILARCLSSHATVIDFSCRACRHAFAAEEANEDPSIVFIRRGLFARQQDGKSLLADSSRILFFNPAQPYRISHPIDGGDDCTIVTVSRPLAREIVGRHAPRAADRGFHEPFPRDSGSATRELWHLHYALLAEGQPASRLARDDLVMELIDTAVRDGQAEEDRTDRKIPRRVAGRTAARHRELALAAIAAIHRDLADPPDLSGLASELNCSAFHLSRVFRSVVGRNLRSYLAAARTRAAADAIARGARNLTDLALALGYVDHSHLTRTFCKEWGVPPSTFRSRFRGGINTRPRVS